MCLGLLFSASMFSHTSKPEENALRHHPDSCARETSGCSLSLLLRGFTYNAVSSRSKPPPVGYDGQMLVQAVEVDYDYNSSRVSAVGNVQLHLFVCAE
jgi:hypothetical protein